MFVDEVEIEFTGGHGGAGKVSFFPLKRGPNGGNGGDGGDIIAYVDLQMANLNRYSGKPFFDAPAGSPGDSFHKHGPRGADLRVPFPLGTVFTDTESGKQIELTSVDQTVLIARGGKGGLGNDAFKTSTYQTPRHAEPGQPGEKIRLSIVLKLIADFGFIGLPNAGKSSLLNELTKAHAKIANYPFTTLEPNLGVLEGKVIADIPGLIEGASKGRGLGIKFLKHIEKVKLLLHCISSESTDLKKDYVAVVNELKEYNPELATKDSVLLFTKIDLITPSEVKEKVKQLKKLHDNVMPISIHDYEGLEKLKKILLA